MGRPYMGMESETKITWDATEDVEGLEGYQVASAEFVRQYSSQKANEGKIQKLFVAEVNAADGSIFQVPVVETLADEIQTVKAQAKVASKFKFPAKKLETSQHTVISIRPYMGKESETNITWDATEDVLGLEGYQLASTDFVSKYTSQKAEEGKIQKLFVAEVNPADGSIFQVPVVETLKDEDQRVKAQTKVASKLIFPALRAKAQQQMIINIRPYMGKESETGITWDIAEDVGGLEGYQLASSEFVESYTSQKVDAGKIQKLFVAEVSSADGSLFQIPIIEKSKNVPKEKAQ